MADILDLEHHQVLEEYKQSLDELIPTVGVEKYLYFPNLDNCL